MIKKLTELFSGLLEDFEPHSASRQSDNGAGGELWTRLYERMERAKCLDYDYIQHTESVGGIETVSDKIDAMSFEECCTWLTWILRGERFCDGLFDLHLRDGTILALIKQAYNTLQGKKAA